MRFISIFVALCFLVSSVAEAKPFHNEISQIFRGTWASNLTDCRDPEGTNQLTVDAESMNYYEGNDYLLIGIEFFGATTRKGSGSLFNGRFTSRLESSLIGESNIRMEIDDGDKNVMYRYPIGNAGEPIAAREVRSVRCVGK